jgi:hypothetical protein
MATTKRAKLLFKVSEFSPEVREGATEGTLRIAPVPFIGTEHRGSEDDEDALEGGHLSFDLRDGISMEEAGAIARFLNQNLISVAVTRFGDAEDMRTEVDNSSLNLSHITEGAKEAIASLRKDLANGNVQAATERLKAVEGWTSRLLDDWGHALNRFR